MIQQNGMFPGDPPAGDPVGRPYSGCIHEVIMASEKIEKLRAKLAEARDVLNTVLDQVGDRWDRQVYSDGAGWTVYQLLIHLMISDRGQTRTVQQIAIGEDPIPADFDLERYNRRSVEKSVGVTPEAARAALAESRAELLTWLETVDEAALDRQGRHASLNIFSVAQILRMMAIHERDHANDLAKALGITTA